MRRKTILLGVGLAGAAGLIYAAAQAGHSHGAPVAGGDPAAHEHMTMNPETASHHMLMGGMIDGPMAALDRPLVLALFGAFVLPELQAELSLTLDQVNQLKAEKAVLVAKSDDFSRRIAEKDRELDALFSPDTSKGQQVKALLEQAAEFRAQQHYSIYTAARKMKGILTPDQRAKLEGWKPEDLRHAAMSHLTLEEFAKASEFLRYAM